MLQWVTVCLRMMWTDSVLFACVSHNLLWVCTHLWQLKDGLSSRAHAFTLGSWVPSRLNHHRNNQDARAAELAAKGHLHLCHQQAWCASTESYHHSQKWSCALQDRDRQGHHLQRQSCPVPLQVSRDFCFKYYFSFDDFSFDAGFKFTYHHISCIMI